MTHVTIGATVLAQLNHLTELTEVRDDSGRILGYFHPLLSAAGYPAGGRRSPFSDEELQRRRHQQTGQALSEVLKNLPPS